MWARAVFLIFVTAVTASGFQLFDHNGWVPVSEDIIFNQIRRETIQSPRQTKFDDVGIKADTLAVPHYRTHKHTIDGNEANAECGDSFSCIDEVSNERYKVQVQRDSHVASFQSADNQNEVNPLRRSKKLADSHSRHFFNPSTPKTEIEFIDKQNYSEKSQENIDVANTYEVTEEITAENTKQEETKFRKVAHEYPARKQNFTNSLIKYLSKYNIQHDDNLQNYALSRRAKAVYPENSNRGDKTIHFRVPIRYNSLNHLSVDPLLAVLLSNYGYYLQGQYGTHNNYKNLYGYLASNNMHNNRPFGAYKLFSDTDSSH